MSILGAIIPKDSITVNVGDTLECVNSMYTNETDHFDVVTSYWDAAVIDVETGSQKAMSDLYAHYNEVRNVTTGEIWKRRYKFH